MQTEPNLIPRDTWQTQQRGTLEQEYEIYRASAEDLGWEVKTLSEWLNS